MSGDPGKPVLDYAPRIGARQHRHGLAGTYLVAASWVVLAIIQWMQPSGAMRSYRTLDPTRYYEMLFSAYLALGLAVCGLIALFRAKHGVAHRLIQRVST